MSGNRATVQGHQLSPRPSGRRFTLTMGSPRVASDALGSRS
jgi:hypothetical protein